MVSKVHKPAATCANLLQYARNVVATRWLEQDVELATSVEEPQTTLNPFVVLLPHTTELPHTAELPETFVPHTTDDPGRRYRTTSKENSQ